MSKTKFQIRRANSKDINALECMEMKSFNSHQFNKKQFRYYLSQDNCICYVTYSKEIFGYILGIIDRRGKKKKARLYSLAVLPNYRKRGYATLLLKQFEKEVLKKNCGLVTLEVKEKNKEAFKLYLREGYKYVDPIKDYYGKNQDGLNMHKLLK